MLCKGTIALSSEGAAVYIHPSIERNMGWFLKICEVEEVEVKEAVHNNCFPVGCNNTRLNETK